VIVLKKVAISSQVQGGLGHQIEANEAEVQVQMLLPAQKESSDF